jgi:hypothetical protein
MSLKYPPPPYKIFWNEKIEFNNNIIPIDFIDYLKQRLNVNYIEIDEQLSKIIKCVNHNEYYLYYYFKYLFEYYSQNKVPNNLFVFSNNETECDIKISHFVGNQNVVFENIKNNTKIQFGIERDIPIPYLTGIYNLLPNDEPQHFNVIPKKYLLTFIGGTFRGFKNNEGVFKREVTINNFIKNNDQYCLSKNLQNKYEKLFYCPLLAKTIEEELVDFEWSKGNFTIEAKQLYLSSVFSWQPDGDTPTRRGFYEALLLGNIPVISYSSYLLYKKLLIGDENVKNICVILNNDDYYNADFVMNYLLKINAVKIYEYQSNIHKISNRLQWNLTSDKNAFTDLIEKILEK